MVWWSHARDVETTKPPGKAAASEFRTAVCNSNWILALGRKISTSFGECYMTVQDFSIDKPGAVYSGDDRERAIAEYSMSLIRQYTGGDLRKPCQPEDELVAAALEFNLRYCRPPLPSRDAAWQARDLEFQSRTLWREGMCL